MNRWGENGGIYSRRGKERRRRGQDVEGREERRRVKVERKDGERGREQEGQREHRDVEIHGRREVGLKATEKK